MKRECDEKRCEDRIANSPSASLITPLGFWIAFPPLTCHHTSNSSKFSVPLPSVSIAAIACTTSFLGLQHRKEKAVT